MQSISFPQVPAGYEILYELPNGFLSRTAVVMKIADPTSRYVCKCIESARLGGPNQVKKFTETAKAAQMVKSRFILPYCDVIQTNQYIFLIREYLLAPTLLEQIQNDDENPNMNGYFVLWKTIVRSYRKLHNVNIAPNFVRPSNIFIAADGGPIITDIYPPFFNAANPQNTSNLVFLAPEFIKGEEIPTKAADTWSLGLLLLYIMTGHVPWMTNNLFKMMQNIMKGTAGLAVEVPDAIKPIIDSSVNVDPNLRVSLSSLYKFNPVVSSICRESPGSKMTKNAIRVQQSTLFNNLNPPKMSKNSTMRQSLAALPTVPSFLLSKDSFQKPTKGNKKFDPFMMD